MKLYERKRERESCIHGIQKGKGRGRLDFSFYGDLTLTRRNV